MGHIIPTLIGRQYLFFYEVPNIKEEKKKTTKEEFDIDRIKTYSVSTLINIVQRENILTADVNLPLKRFYETNQSTKEYPDYNLADPASKERLHYLEINVSKHLQHYV